MGFLDKIKEGAGTAKDMAAAAAERAKEEAKELNLKRQIGNEQEVLGAKAYELAESGAISHPDLTPGVERIRGLKAELEGIQESQAEGSSDAEGEASDQPPTG